MPTTNTILLLVIAGINLVSVLMLKHMGRVVKTAAEDILRVEKATNSMKDALVASTAKASHAEGVEDERERAKGPTSL